MKELKIPAEDTHPSVEWEDHAGLVEALRSGSSEALRSIMETYRDPLMHFARQILSGAGDAEDVVQEAFVRVWTRRNRLRPEGNLKALLFATVRSIALDEYRRWKRRTRWDLGPMVYSAPHSPMEDLLGSELSRLAESAIHSLPPRRRAIFQMVRKKGLTYRETADTLGVSPQTVANSMSSALADLRKSLGPVLEDRIA